MEISDLEDYGYALPTELIAQRPVEPQDMAQLLIYHRQTGQISEDVYLNLSQYLPQKSVLVFNNSKVIPARIMSHRPTGGKCEVLILSEEATHQYQVMLSRRIPKFETLVLDGGLEAQVVDQQEQFYSLKIEKDFPTLIQYLEQFGSMPVPPYIKNPDEKEVLKTEYQTVFAKKYGSVAAPTASLHFTKRLLRQLTQQKIAYEFITLHVGLGTFLPLKEENLTQKKLHRESYEIEPAVWERLLAYKAKGYKIIPVGTTAMRTLESVKGQSRKHLSLSGNTNIFIQPGDTFFMCDGLITNFHLPKTSLLLLVSAFIGSRDKTMALYDYAVKHHYRFYSFGDGMLIL